MALGSKLVGIAAGIATRKISQKVLDKVWVRTKGTEPPAHPAAPGTPWREALSWAVASGAAAGVARVVAMKGSATTVEKITGKPPKGMEGPGPKTRRRG